MGLAHPFSGINCPHQTVCNQVRYLLFDVLFLDVLFLIVYAARAG
ncbi:MAG: hypothetical protein ACI95X_003100 [Paraglaciecola sp.]|jgi:hypothetical protein